MFIIGQLLASLALLFSMIFKIFYFLLVIRIILSWFAVDSYSEPFQTLFRITEPILAPFRRLPIQIGMFDLSPVLAFLALSFLDHFIVGILRGLALQLGAAAV